MTEKRHPHPNPLPRRARERKKESKEREKEKRVEDFPLSSCLSALIGNPTPAVIPEIFYWETKFLSFLLLFPGDYKGGLPFIVMDPSQKHSGVTNKGDFAF